MSSSTTKKYFSYIKVLHEIQQYATGKGLGDLFGRKDLTITTDYESALIRALRKVNANVHGCFFHFCQSIWRFVHTHGLAMKYNTEKPFRDSVRSLMALALIKSNDIRDSFHTMKGLVNDDDLLLVYEYLERTWLDGFGVEMICQYHELFRTNNNAEAFHSSLRRVFFSPHPRFDEFIEKMCELMDSAETEYRAERLHPKRLNHRILRSYNLVKNLTDNFYNDRVLGLPLPEFLGRIGEIFNEEACFECGYEEGCEATFEYVHDDFYAEGVPMEFDDDNGDLW